MLSPENSVELANLLKVSANDDPAVEAFAKKYSGQTISFDGSISAFNPHSSMKTRYDILIGPGDAGDQTAIGPTFQFRDVNTTSDLNYVGAIPDTIGVGTKLTVTAEVNQYEPATGLFLLKPVETKVR